MRYQENYYYLQSLCETVHCLSNIIYIHTSNKPFCEKLQSVEDEAALVITGAMQGTSS